jgi:hypothetical protein
VIVKKMADGVGIHGVDYPFPTIAAIQGL